MTESAPVCLRQAEHVFTTPPAKLALTEYDLHIWRMDLTNSKQPLEGYYQQLSPDEQARADRFYFPRHRRRFILARYALRTSLSQYDTRPAHAWQFHYGEQGKPEIALAQNTLQLQFNVSHSHEMALIAVTQQHAVGVDVEYCLRERHGLDLAKRFFANAEYKALAALPTSQQADAFFQIWTGKEAFIKAIGKGLSYPLDKFGVSLARPAKLSFIDDESLAIADWQLHTFSPASHYLATVCHAAGINTRQFYELTIS